jgi:iron complex transport system ATP-binding protein
MGEPFFELEDATVYRESRKVFEKLSLRLELGTHTAVLGPNGSGKSTLLKLIYREIYPAAFPNSRMRTFGKEQLNAWELRRRIGLVSADLQKGYMEAVTGRDVVLSGFYSSIAVGGTQEYEKEHYRRTAEVLKLTEAEELASRLYGSLSTGEQRRLLLARALVHDPDILLLDEPTAGLDIVARFAFFDTLNGALGAGKTVLLVTHHIEEIPPAVDRVILLKGCALFAQGPPDATITGSVLSRLYGQNLEVVERGGYRYLLPLFSR